MSVVFARFETSEIDKVRELVVKNGGTVEGVQKDPETPTFTVERAIAANSQEEAEKIVDAALSSMVGSAKVG